MMSDPSMTKIQAPLTTRSGIGAADHIRRRHGIHHPWTWGILPHPKSGIPVPAAGHPDIWSTGSFPSFPPIVTVSRCLMSHPLPQTGAVMAIDFGTKRLGVAVTTEDRTFVLPRDTITRTVLKEDLVQLQAIATEAKVTLIALGLPINADATEGPMARATREFATALTDGLSLPLCFVDERYTSEEAEEHLRLRYPRDTRKRRSLRDRGAAVLILKTFLDHGPLRSVDPSE